MPRTGLPASEIRARAIDAALERIRAHGFDKVRLTDVAHDLGVSHVALYAHFASKEALLDAVLERWLDEVTAALDRVCASSRKPRLKLEQWFVQQYAMKRDRALHDRATYAAFETATAAQKPFVQRYLARRNAQLAGLLEDAGVAARHVDVVLDGMAGFSHPRLILESAEHDREPQLKRVLHALLRGLEA